MHRLRSTTPVDNNPFSPQETQRKSTVSAPLTQNVTESCNPYRGTRPAVYPQKSTSPFISIALRRSLFSFFIYYFLPGRCWWEIDLAARLLYNRRSLKRGPFRPAMDHQVTHHETHFPTQHPQTRSYPRFPCSYGYQKWSCRPVASSRQRS